MIPRYSNLEEGLTDLMAKMEVDMPQFNDIVDRAFYGRTNAAERLMSKARESCTIHTAWMEMVGNPWSLVSNEFDKICWFLSYEQLAEHFCVPLSWINALHIQVYTDPMKRTWKCVGLNLTEDGYLTESAYAAHIDGIEIGLLPDVGHDVSQLRDPKHVEMNEENKQTFEDYLKVMDNNSSVNDILKGFDFTLA